MARRRAAKRKALMPDPVYQNHLVEMITNHLMRRGKKLLAYRICYSSMRELGEITQKDPISVLEQAVRNVTPLVEVKSKRRGGAAYQVPVAVSPERGTTLAIRWILSSCRNRSGRTMVSRLTNEFLDASKNVGAAIRRKEEINKMAEANKAFAASRF
uniref:Small ribosomal subunit protein uS7c n=1 Tax=Trebouxiophyceae sp. MX-AZ01 TaxID=1208065 RepID=J7KBV9_9CHLO|nr:ribosomal protein S7 [Trebouxiophyceae sp. MX-AZ01]AFQ93848.1 ribosomal protein S7 [Trebouxiophyceae sp. MX-AZ01]